MGYERTHSFQKKSKYTPQPTTQFSTRPFAAPVQKKPQEHKTPDELENETFNHNKFEAFGLQLKEKSGTITPVEQERLGVLQAKMDDFWAQRRERASLMSNDLSKIPVHPPEGQATPQLQPLGRQGTPGVPMEEERSHLKSPQPSSASPIQRQLTIGEPGDKYEQEADRVASQVVEQIHAPASAQPTQGQSVQRQEEKTEELQRQPEITALQRQEEKPEELQAKSILQRREASSAGEATNDLDTAINSARGGGQPLDAGLQRSMGQAMGADFTGVRVHTDAQSDQLNQSIQAKAFTTGQDVFFRQGAYEPGSRGGQELIAHELTHVVQQNGGAVQRSPLPQQPLAQHSAKMPVNFLSSIAKESLQRITHTVSPNPPVAIDIGTLDDAGCRLHLQRIGRINAGRPIGNDSEYHYDPGDRAAIAARQEELLEARRVALVNALASQLAALGTEADHQVQPPWNGKNPTGAEGTEVAGANVAPVEVTIVNEWIAFLGAAPYSHKHPRTGVVDNTRLVSADGQRSIRYGNHERNSKAGNHHFHQETWVYDPNSNTVTVSNTLRRASVK